MTSQITGVLAHAYFKDNPETETKGHGTTPGPHREAFKVRFFPASAKTYKDSRE